MVPVSPGNSASAGIVHASGKVFPRETVHLLASFMSLVKCFPGKQPEIIYLILPEATSLICLNNGSTYSSVKCPLNEE
ncbi:hypothetical protein HmCmsJML240_05033 [Escherichia coli]|nr:hypothetical protein HmCmsJML240_05033 [Escherichia coli]